MILADSLRSEHRQFRGTPADGRTSEPGATGIWLRIYSVYKVMMLNRIHKTHKRARMLFIRILLAGTVQIGREEASSRGVDRFVGDSG